MTLAIEEVHNSIRKRARFARECPICSKKLKFGVEMADLEAITEFPYPHILLHGDPLHAAIFYIDANFTVRGVEASSSIEVLQEGTTFGSILKKWTNRF